MWRDKKHKVRKWSLRKEWWKECGWEWISVCVCVCVCVCSSPVSPHIHQRLHPIHSNMTETWSNLPDQKHLILKWLPNESPFRWTGSNAHTYAHKWFCMHALKCAHLHAQIHAFPPNSQSITLTHPHTHTQPQGKCGNVFFKDWIQRDELRHFNLTYAKSGTEYSCRETQNRRYNQKCHFPAHEAGFTHIRREQKDLTNFHRQYK